jgi:hypothetical protein
VKAKYDTKCMICGEGDDGEEGVKVVEGDGSSGKSDAQTTNVFFAFLSNIFQHSFLPS